MTTKRAQITDSGEAVRVFAAAHPFSAERTERTVPPGQPLDEIVAGMQPDALLRRHAHVWLDGHYIPREHWPRVRPKAGTAVAIRMAPMGGGGGGGKNPLRSVLSLALLAASPALAGGVEGVLGLAGSGSFLGVSLGGLITTGVSFLGKLAMSALAPPSGSPFSDVKESPTLFIQGAQNEASPFSRVPRVLGTHRMVPPLGALPYTETQGNDQYLRMLFIWGYGPLNISDLKIGETPLEDFQGVEIETRQGYDTDAPITLYSDSVIQNDLETLVTQAGGYIVRTTDTDADEISVDVTFPRGLFQFTSSSAKTSATVQMTVGYSPKDAGTWTDQTFTWTATQTAALRESVRFVVPQGQYDVRVSRVTVDSTDDNVFDEMAWTALRTVRYTAPVNMQGVAMTALRIQASDQLSGVIDRFNGVVQSVLPDWTGSAWTAQATANPASLFRHVLQGNANARPLDDSRLDLDKIQAWHDSCAAAGREFNGVIDYDISVRQVLQAIAAAGRAAPALIDGKWAVVEDAPQTVPIQHFTPRNTWGFQGGKSFGELPHALRVRFINRDKGWLQDERLVFDDGYDETSASKYDVLELNGVTSSDQAWSDARYHIATARLRPETYSFFADVEHIVCTRGDLIRFTHDVPLFGLMSARVKSTTVSSGNITAITLDAQVEMEADKAYALRVRLQDGSSLLLPLVTAAGTSVTLALAAPCAESGGPQPGDLALFGESGSESVELIVRSIEPQADLSAKITCVDAAPGVFTADTGKIPPWSAQVTLPPELLRPPAPALISVQTGEEVMIRNADGSLTSTITVTLAPPLYPLPLVPEVKIRETGAAGFRTATFTASSGQIAILDIQQGLYYDISIVYGNAAGVFSPATLAANVLVTGTSGGPPDVQDFRITVAGTSAYLSWDPVVAVNLSHYRVKYGAALTGASWASSVDLAVQVTGTSASVPARAGTYLIKAVDLSGNESAGAAVIVSTIAGLAGYNAVASVTEDPAFSGAKTGVVIDTGAIRLDTGFAAGTYVFAGAVDLGAVFTSSVSADLTVAGVNLANLVDGWSNVDDVSDWDGVADPADWGVQIQLRATPDDPGASPAWSAWQNLSIGDYTARAFQFQALLSADVPGISPLISGLTANVDMPDRVAGANNITSLSTDAGGTAVTFAAAFHATPAIAISAYGMATADYYALSAQSASGFTVAFFNASGTRVTRVFDYLAKGYGVQQ